MAPVVRLEATHLLIDSSTYKITDKCIGKFCSGAFLCGSGRSVPVRASVCCIGIFFILCSENAVQQSALLPPQERLLASDVKQVTFHVDRRE